MTPKAEEQEVKDIDFENLFIDEEDEVKKDDEESEVEDSEADEEKEVTEDDESEDDNSEDDSEEDDLFVSLAKKVGIEIPEEGLDYTDDEDGLLQFMSDYAEAEKQSYLEDVLMNKYPVVGNLLQHVVDGGDPSDFIKINHPQTDYSTIVLEDKDENIPQQEKIYRDFFRKQGLSEEDINAQLKIAKAGGTLFATAGAYQTLLINQQKQEKEQLKARHLEQKEKAQREALEFKNTIDKIVDSREVKGIQIGVKETSKLKDYITKPVKDGLSQRDIDAQALDMEQEVLLSYMLMHGFNLEKLIKVAAKREETKSLRKRLLKEKAKPSQKTGVKTDAIDFGSGLITT